MIKFPKKPLQLSAEGYQAVKVHTLMQFAISQDKSEETFAKICESIYNKIIPDGRGDL